MTDEDQMTRLREVCEGYGIPVDVDGLVRHVTGNVGLAKYLEGQCDLIDELRALETHGALPPDGDR